MEGRKLPQGITYSRLLDLDDLGAVAPGDICHAPPKTPLTQMIALSPGSMTLQTAASMPALPVPETGKVTRFSVPKSPRSITWQSSITERKSGSRWPTTFVLIALRTRGCTGLGRAPEEGEDGDSALQRSFVSLSQRDNENRPDLGGRMVCRTGTSRHL